MQCLKKPAPAGFFMGAAGVTDDLDARSTLLQLLGDQNIHIFQVGFRVFLHVLQAG